ncbi:haloalkanoic acid dehalogenase [Cerioporus squamosus]|nr:haloalkanoic acid dehalogenase [Cerioporus squamosus]
MSPTTNERSFAKYKTLVFDCYGTLIDWETGIYTGLRPLFEASGKPSDRRAVIEAFLAVERDLQARHPTMLYSDLLAKVYTTLQARLQNKPTPPDALRDDASTVTSVVSSAHTSSGTEEMVPAPVGPSTATLDQSPSPAEAFAQSVGTWPPFPDTPAALKSLSRRFKLVILSNVDRVSIAKTRKLMEGPGGFAFDAVYTAQDAGAYKPAPEMLTYALEHLKDEFGIAQDEVLMTAQSMTHDIIPARGRGIATAWIDRPNAICRPVDAKGDEALFVFPTLGDMADAVEKATS